MSAVVIGSAIFGADGQLVEVRVSDEGRFLGCWKPGYDDVWADQLHKKDDVRRAVQLEIGRAVMAAHGVASGVSI